MKKRSETTQAEKSMLKAIYFLLFLAVGAALAVLMILAALVNSLWRWLSP